MRLVKKYHPMKQFIYLVALSLISLTACVTPPEYPIEPVIDFIGLNKNIVNQGAFGTDTLIITFSFTDGDGDLGVDTALTAFLIDTRDGSEIPYKIPYIPEQGNNNAISGEITIEVYTHCCIFDDGSDPCTSSPNQSSDEMSYQIYIVDRAGNESNLTQTSTIVVNCN